MGTLGVVKLVAEIITIKMLVLQQVVSGKVEAVMNSGAQILDIETKVTVSTILLEKIVIGTVLGAKNLVVGVKLILLPVQLQILVMANLVSGTLILVVGVNKLLVGTGMVGHLKVMNLIV